MVAGVNSSTTVFNASSPFIVADSKQTSVTAKTETTLLTPKKDSSQIADIANIFSPAADISSLAPQSASVVLTEQAREKPIILQNPNPPLDNSPLGNLDIYKELLTAPLTPEEDKGKTDNSFIKPSIQLDSFGKSENPNIISETAPQKATDAAMETLLTPKAPEESRQIDRAILTSAIAAYQQTSPALTGTAPALSVEA